MTVEIVKGRKYIDRTDGEVLVAVVDGTDKDGDGAFERYGCWYIVDTGNLVPAVDEAWRNLYETRHPGFWCRSRETCDVRSEPLGGRFAVQHRLPDGTMEFDCVKDGS